VSDDSYSYDSDMWNGDPSSRPNKLLRRPITGLAALLSGTAIIAACCLPRCLRRCCRRSTEDHGTTNPARRPRRRNGRGGEDDGTSESGYGRGRRRKGGLHGTAEEAAALYREQGHREGDVEGDVRANMAAADQSSEDEDEGEDEVMRAPAKGGKRCMRGTGATYPTDEAAAAAKLLIAANIDDDRAGGGAASSAAQGHERVTLYVQRADNGYEELPASLPVRSSQGDDLTVGEMVVHALDLAVMTFPPSEREAAAITVAKMISYRNDLPVAVFDLDEEPLPAERWDETLGCHVSCMRIDRPHHQVKLPQALVAASPRDNPSLAPLAPHAFAHADELAGPEHRFAPGLEMDME